MNLTFTRSREASLSLGGVPRADLLPPAVGLAAKARSTRRALSVFVVAMVIVTITGFGGASLFAAQSRQRLDAESARTATLLAQKGKYSEVRKITSLLKLSTTARKVGSSTSIDWKTYVDLVQASLPIGTTVTTLAVTSGTPMTPFTASTTPLQGKRIAELIFTATSGSIPDVQLWLDGLAKLIGFVDAAPGSVSLTDGIYNVTITMHINDKALSNVYVDKPDVPATEGSK